jgi:hypothetical protein
MRRTPVDATKALGSIADFTFRFIVAILRAFLGVCQGAARGVNSQPFTDSR